MGAEPVFMDCDETMCMDTAKLAKYLEEECDYDGQTLTEKQSGKTVKAIIPVHILGNLANLEAILPLAEKYSLKVLEDASEAMGCFWSTGLLSGKHAGTAGDMGVFSFNANKIITTGGGGMIVARHEKNLMKASYLTTTAKDDGLFFVHDEVGYNYRMLNLQAALGVSQIGELEKFIEIKRRNYELYRGLLYGAKGLHLLPFMEGIRSNYWFYSLYVEGNGADNRNVLLQKLIDKGIQCRPLWKLINEQKAYRSFRSYKIEKAKEYEAHILNIPCSSNLTEEDVRYVAETVLALS
jgi:dTDP-4-amino-4,6-dideoxygalactose transaminase